MSSKGLHWYNNGEVEINAEACPAGFVAGRLPKTPDTINKIKQGLANISQEDKIKANIKRSETLKNTFANMSDEDKQLMYQHRSDSYQSKTEEEKQKIRDKISTATLGKNKGKTPINKGVPMSDEQKKKVSDGMKKFMSTVSDDYLKQWRQKVSNSMKINNTYGKSQEEENYYKTLVQKYGEDDVIRQYSDPKRYPFDCDFYIPSEDLFIDINKHWTRGGHPFDKMSLNDISKLEQWEENAKTSQFYKNAIYVWTDLDVRKQDCAKQNHLNYQVIY